MHTGMLWFDNSGRSLDTKIQIAADYYFRKYGLNPDICLAHPSMKNNFSEYELTLSGDLKMKVRPYRPVLPGHMWIGISEKKQP